MSSAKKTLALIILDGWGHREERKDNAIANAHTPTWDALWANQPHTLISGSGMDVGLPDGQMGNSEVGHMSLGAGRVVYQSISRIDKAISDGDFFKNDRYIEAIDKAAQADKAVHVFGLLSPGGVHSHENHIHAIAAMAAKRGCKKLFIHAFLDGRDTPPRSASASIVRLENKLTELGVGRIATICGRYYAMDRDQRWDRIEQAYTLLTENKSDYEADSAISALEQAYARDENDEFVKPTVIAAKDATSSAISDGDSIIFMNFRADRARQITQTFVNNDFKGFTRNVTPKLAAFVMTTEYADNLAAQCAFPPQKLTNSLPEYLADLGKTQLRIAETEKYAHVTFFFSGGREAVFPGEERILVNSPDVATYDLQPEMSAPEVTEKLCEAIRSGKFDVIICNYANGDMVGHTGNFDAAVLAAQAIDESLRQVVDAINEVDGQALITADHGNCEQMQDYESGQVHTQHTTELVPLIYIGGKSIQLEAKGRLADVAPTMLKLMELPQPTEMTGKSLV